MLDAPRPTEPITDTALDGIERELASVPPASSAYCPDEESSLRFHLHVLAPRMIAELQRHRAAMKRLEEWARDIDVDVADAVPMELSMSLADVAAALRQTIKVG